jgi:hypothetical protein
MAALVQIRADQLHALTSSERRQLVEVLRKLSLALEQRA